MLCSFLVFPWETVALKEKSFPLLITSILNTLFGWDDGLWFAAWTWQAVCCARRKTRWNQTFKQGLCVRVDNNSTKKNNQQNSADVWADRTKLRMFHIWMAIIRSPGVVWQNQELDTYMKWICVFISCQARNQRGQSGNCPARNVWKRMYLLGTSTSYIILSPKISVGCGPVSCHQ